MVQGLIASLLRFKTKRLSVKPVKLPDATERTRVIDMIVSFTKTSTKTECIWQGLRSERLPPEVQSRALAKLRMLNRANSLVDLRNPPGNQLHALRNDRAGQHSIRINDQWRICFRFKDGNAYDVEIADYH